MLESALILTVLTAVAAVLVLHPRLQRSSAWKAMVTPLSSIMGSGFLVCAPLLADNVGYDAVLAMGGLLLIAFAVGGAVRYNIRYVEPMLATQSGPKALGRLENGGRWVLSAAYVISISYYLQLLAAFVLHMTGVDDALIAKLVTTGVLVAITVIGSTWGLDALESVERYAIGLNLGTISAFLLGLAWFNIAEVHEGIWAIPDVPPNLNAHSGRVVLGLLIVVQGFETSRYLGDGHPPEERIATMRWAQLLSAAIYITFLSLMTVLFERHMGGGVTVIVDVAGRIAPVLPVAVVVAAVGSQFSAAVADTAGAGGLVQEVSGGRLDGSRAYLVLGALTIALTWLTDVMQVISIASRAFALFYAIQCAVGAVAATHASHKPRAAWFALLSLVCLAVVVLGIPSE
ncbi:MAG: hypothetical protein DRJ42_10220 [Deltaproteobacteria bacterium]|nr:MAG: hypothetical protein DRJ42_10220 [Deltaproteobacteria bacterium]